MIGIIRLVCILISISSTPAFATSVTPVNIEMASTGQRSRSQILVTNTTAEPVAIEPSVSLLSYDQQGKSHTLPSGDDFLILPTQTMIAPGASQTFRVQWLGEPDLAESRSYLIAMNQLPVRGPRSKAGVQILVSFGVAVNVAPPLGKASLKVIGSGVTAGRKPFLTLENATAVHALLKDADIMLSGDGWSKSLPAGSLQTALGTGIVQPRRTRTFTLPVELPANVRQVTAAIDYRPSR